MRRFFMDRVFLEKKIALYRELLVRNLPREECIILEALLGEAETWLNELANGPSRLSGASAANEVPPPAG